MSPRQPAKTDGRGHQGRRWLLRLGLVAGGLLLGVLAAELAGRLIRPPGDAEWLFNPPVRRFP
mgnify:FL=1